MQRSVSPLGRKFLYAHEGVVTKAYRCPAGEWTIGAGLTSKSGVVKVTPGMIITEAENDRLVDLALSKNYVPRVLAALGSECSQQALDAGASFDYNTGAIHKASWVKAFLARDFVQTHARLLLWTKGGGKVLPGLKRRREAEYDLLVHGDYALAAPPPAIQPRGGAQILVRLSAAEIENIKEGLRSLGFDATAPRGCIGLHAVLKYQESRDLLVDGKVGIATLSSLQRDLDARLKGKRAGLGAAAGTSVVAGDQVTNVVTNPLPADPSAVLPDQVATLVGVGIIAAAALYLVIQAVRYRDVIASSIDGMAPRLAALLRSF